MAIAVNDGGRARLLPQRRVGRAAQAGDRRGHALRARLDRQDVHRPARRRAARPAGAADRLPAVVRGAVGVRPDSGRASAHALGRAHPRRGDRPPTRASTSGRSATPRRGSRPGEHFYYSNVGYRTLGYALEAATGTPYRELLASRILEPIGSRADGAGDHRRHPRPDGGGLRPAARRPHAFAGRPALPGAVARDGYGRRLARLDRRRSGGVRTRICSEGRREDTHLGASCSTPATGGATAMGSSARASSSGHGGSMPGFASTMLGDLESGNRRRRRS